MNSAICGQAETPPLRFEMSFGPAMVAILARAAMTPPKRYSQQPPLSVPPPGPGWCRIAALPVPDEEDGLDGDATRGALVEALLGTHCFDAAR